MELSLPMFHRHFDIPESDATLMPAVVAPGIVPLILLLFVLKLILLRGAQFDVVGGSKLWLG